MGKYALLLGVIGIIVYAFYDAILTGLIVLGIGLGVFGLCAGLITLYVGLQRAKRERIMTKVAGIQTVQDGYGMLHLIDVTTNHSQNLTLDARAYRNGHYEEPTESERDNLRYILASRHAAASKMIIDQAQLPAHTEQQIDLLTLVDQYPHCLIWGGTGGGKTSLLRTIAHRRKMMGHQVIVLDRCEHPAKWEGLERMDTDGKINRTIRVLFAILEQNVEALRTGQAVESDFKQITVITDEWTEIVAENEIARLFIRKMVRLSRKYGIYLVFATQTDLATDLGLDGSYKTINGFLRLEIKQINDNQRIAAAKVGLNQKLGEFAVPMPPPVPAMVSTGYRAPDLSIEPVEIIEQVRCCPMCGEEVEGSAVYCSNACKQKAYRVRSN